MAKKIRAGKGFTLAETLIAILILSLVTVAGTAAVTTVLSVRNRMIQVANAQMLASTAAEAVADELRFGQDLTVSKDKDFITMGSSLYGAGSKLTLSAEAASAGQLVVTGADGITREMLGAKAYDDLHFSGLEFTLNEPDPAAGAAAEASVTVAMTVADAAGHDLWSTEFTVVPLNGAGKEA